MASHYYSWHHGEIHYQRKGLGDPLLLVHNVYLGADHQEYHRNIDALARRHTVYAIDLLGFGQSDAPRMKYTAAQYVELIFDFLREEVGQPANVIASGLSCAYVTEVAAWRSNLFEKLIFICPRSEPTGMDIPRWAAPIRHFMLSTPAISTGTYDTITSRDEIANYLRNCFYNPKHITAELVERLYENARQKGATYPYASLLTGYLDSRLLESLPKVPNPVMLLWGRHARPAPVEHSVRLIALAQRSHLEVVEDAGAWVHDERSAVVNDLVLRYLGGEIETAPPRPAAESA